ncbi:hypothetical protein B566_EDAN012683 [Ephemera danica]|nr:hypothetical protein B566_EDAN012683 [Ephemera danica]
MSLRIEQKSAMSALSFALSCIILCLLHQVSEAQVKMPGQCQNVTVEQNFDVSKYVGLWYEQKRYHSIFEHNSKCVTATYTQNENGTVGVRNAHVNSTTDEAGFIEGYAEIDSTTGEGKLLVYFPSVMGNRAGKYWVLKTDYTSFSVVWSCTQVSPVMNIQMAWILTRERTPSEVTLQEAQAIADLNHLKNEEFIIADQTNCL